MVHSKLPTAPVAITRAHRGPGPAFTDTEEALRVTRLYLFLVFALLLAACGSPAPAGQATTATAPGGAGEPAAVSASPTAPSGVGAEGASETPSPSTTGVSGPLRNLKVALLVNGTLGDKSFFDSANEGMKRAESELGASIEVVQEQNAAAWEDTLRQLAEGGYDLVIVGTFQMIDPLTAVAPDYPDQKFIIFDAPVNAPNVASITYAQNEGSFLAGVLAACASKSKELKGLSGQTKIGAVGGENIDVINDFITGYEAGAQYVDPKFEVLKSYIGVGPQAYNDPNRGKELAAEQLRQGANVVFGVAGGSGVGVIDAAKEQNRYAIGVDSNQNSLAPGVVLSSMLKQVGNSVFDLIRMEASGSLPTGKVYRYGIENNGIGLAEDDLYEQYVPQECQDQVDKAKEDIARKKVQVPTAFQ
jgi:basic membrane protein A